MIKTVLSVIIPLASVFLGAYFQGKIGLKELNIMITVMGAALYFATGAAYLILFVMDGSRRLCNLHYACLGFLFCGLTVAWIIFAQVRCAFPQVLDFIYGFATIYLFLVLIKQPLVLIAKIQKERSGR